MKTNLEEARKSLQLAGYDVGAFQVLRRDPSVHPSVICFHAQQAVEKSLKAVLFIYQVEFERTHDLVKLAQLLLEKGVDLPVSEDQLRALNPFAVTYRYDILELSNPPMDLISKLMDDIFLWAEEQLRLNSE